MVYGLLHILLRAEDQNKGSDSSIQVASVHIQDFPPALDFGMLSNVFFLKDPVFLEFHWLVLLRSAEKTEWTREQ